MIQSIKKLLKDAYNCKIKDSQGTTAFLNPKNKILSITNLATTTALTSIKNKISNINYLVKNVDYDAEIEDIKIKHFTTSGYNKFSSNILHAKKTGKKIVNESGLNKKIKTFATEEEIKQIRGT